MFCCIIQGALIWGGALEAPLFAASSEISSPNQHQLDVKISVDKPSSQEQETNQSERTLSIIKPDGVENHHIGEILARFEKAGLTIIGLQMKQLTRKEAEQFYQEHKTRPFFPKLVDFMSSGPVVILVLEGKGAIQKNRDLMGSTDPKKATAGTIRADFAQSIDANTVHGSDSADAAQREILFFFKDNQLHPVQ
jgi:nucleoside-diphosphate kinase